MKANKVAAVILVAALLGGCSDSKTRSEEVVGLHEAALAGDVETISQHIAFGADLDEKDAYGSTPLVVATTFGRTDAAVALIEAGADLAIANSEGSTPLHIAAFLCYPDIVEALLEKGADVEAKNVGGRTALESVDGPFEDVRGIYDAIGGALGPLGLTLDYERIRSTRPEIAEMLRAAAAS